MASLGKRDDLYHAWLAADDAWSAELQRVFGKFASDYRYTKAGKGEAGSTLRRLHDAIEPARLAYHIEKELCEAEKLRA